MKNKEIVNSNSAYKSIKLILLKARGKSFRAIDNIIVKAYWNVGKIIIEEEQKGADRAEYGKRIIESFSKKLTKDFGKGFSPTNLKYFRLFYLTFPKGHALRDELSWTHYRLILKIENIESRNFYITECLESRWSTRELERQINSLFFERISLSKNKDEIKKLSQHGQILDKTSDLVKDPYVLEFLGLEDKTDFVEKELEQYLIDNLEKFILELGKGFSFVARQKRITLDGDHFYIDLVFYNRFTKSFVLLDLKVGKLTHQDTDKCRCIYTITKEHRRSKVKMIRSVLFFAQIKMMQLSNLHYQKTRKIYLLQNICCIFQQSRNLKQR